MRSSIERELDLSPHTYYFVTVTKSLLIYLAVLRCGMWDISFGCLGLVALLSCGVLVHQPGIEPTSPALKGKFLNIRTCVLSCVQLFATLWTMALQAPLSLKFFRQEYWSGLPFPTPGDLPDPGIEPASPALAGKSFTTEPPGKPLVTGPQCKPPNYFSLTISFLIKSIEE